MTVSIGAFTFPETTTVVDVRTEFVLGRVRKVVRLSSVLNRFTDRDDYRAAVAQLDAEVERFDRGESNLSIHSGRFLAGRRRKYIATRDEERCVSVVTLEALADDRYERSETLHTSEQPIAASPQTVALDTSGNWESLPRITLTANAALSNPALAGDSGTMTVAVDLDPGDVLVVDSDLRTVTVNGANRIQSASGDFPALAPGGGELTYSATAATHDSDITVTWRDRWI